MKTGIKLKIAGLIVSMQGDCELRLKSKPKIEGLTGYQPPHYFYEGNGQPHIYIDVKAARRRPAVRGVESLFITRRFESGDEDWRWGKKDHSYIYRARRQVAFVNEACDRATAHVVSKGKIPQWTVGEVVCNFLQVLLINYMAQRDIGIIAHAAALRDAICGGVIFAGKSQSGKSTTARIWRENSGAKILNDDRVIVRREGGGYRMHNSPWRGSYNDYPMLRMSAPIDKVFFIHPARKNTVRRPAPGESFNMLFPAIFPPFWDKCGLEKTVSFCHELVERLPCYRLGFVKDKRVIEFVRRV
ncbi:MAG: hypothetical protein V2A66_01375 [Pseudomonadota bacterium]